MSYYLLCFLMAVTGFMGAYSFADQLEEQDPVRVAQRLKDCVAQNLALRDGRTNRSIQRACKKAIADGSYHDPNISLDGMIKSQPQR